MFLFFSRPPKAERKGASAAWLAFHLDAAPVGIQNMLNDRQPDSRAAPTGTSFIGFVEALPDSTRLRRRHADALIANGHTAASSLQSSRT